jgi:hypothetical protein
MRVDIGLRRHYGTDAKTSSFGNYVFFIPEYPFEKGPQLELNVPTELPEEKYAFLEL